MSSESDENGPPTRGPPSNSQLTERLARVEEKQDHVVAQIDRVAESLDEDLAEIETSVEAIEPRHERLWHTYQAIKWVATITITGGVAGRALGFI